MHHISLYHSGHRKENSHAGAFLLLHGCFLLPRSKVSVQIRFSLEIPNLNRLCGGFRSVKTESHRELIPCIIQGNGFLSADQKIPRNLSSFSMGSCWVSPQWMQ